MSIGRRRLRRGLVLAGCLFGAPVMPWVLLACVPIAAGLGLHLWSKGCLEQNRRLTTAGPYRFVRNPFYLANALIEVGLCLLINRWWIALPYALLWRRAYRETIESEEARLHALFPDAYPAYVEAVPRLWPDGRAWSASDTTGGFSFENPGLARGQEYARLLGIALGALAILAAALLRREGGALLVPEAAGLRAVLLGIPALWGVKLALAEAFRRPESALLPGSDGQFSGRVGLGLVAASLLLWAAHPAVAVFSAAWGAVAALDHRGVRRVASATKRLPWRYRDPLLAGTLGFLLLLALLPGI